MKLAIHIQAVISLMKALLAPHPTTVTLSINLTTDAGRLFRAFY